MPKLNKQAIETVKTVVIAVLLSAMVAFVAGVKYEQIAQSEIDEAVQAAQLIEDAGEPVKK